MKIMYPPGYHHNGYLATHVHGHMIYSYTLVVSKSRRVLNDGRKRCFHNDKYIMPILPRLD